MRHRPAARLLCPHDRSPLGTFGEVRPGGGWMIRLYGCRGCRSFEFAAVAEDVIGTVRPVTRWRLDPDSGLYVCTESGRVPPGWIDLAATLLPAP